MDAMIRVMETSVIFAGAGNVKSLTHKGGNPKDSQVSPFQKTLNEINRFKDSLTQGRTMDLVASLTASPPYKAVLPVENEYFSNKSPAPLMDGQFIVLGKVVRHIPKGSNESINLLRGTSLAHAPDEVVEQFKSAFLGLQVSGMKMPELQTKLESPALQVVPIAIYI